MSQVEAQESVETTSRLKLYPAYRDSGIKWLGDIPEHWEIKRIKHSTYVKGRIGWKGLRSDEFIDEGPYLVTGTDFVNGKVNWSSCYHVSEARYIEDPYIQLREGDLLITKDGTIGKVAVVCDLQGKATLNSGIFLTRQITKHNLPEFMYWVISSGVFTEFIEYTKAGSTISHLYQNVFVEFAFPVPSHYEQRAIASFLDHETSRIDTLISRKQRQLELLREKRAALISHAVTRGLNPDVKMKDSGIEWLGEIPEHWSVLPLKRKWTVTDCKHKTVSFLDEGVPVASIGEVKEINIDLHNAKKTSFDEYNELIEGGRKPKRGDIIFSRNATVGAASFVNTDKMFCMGQDVCLISSKHNNQRFLLYQLKSLLVIHQLESVMVGATFNRINVAHIKNFLVSCPPKEEQYEIAEYCDQIYSHTETVIQKVNESVTKLQEYRTALISAAVTGKIDVRKEVSNERPQAL